MRRTRFCPTSPVGSQLRLQLRGYGRLAWTVLGAGQQWPLDAGTRYSVQSAQSGTMVYLVEAQQPHFFACHRRSPLRLPSPSPSHARPLQSSLVVSRVSMAWEWPSSP